MIKLKNQEYQRFTEDRSKAIHLHEQRIDGVWTPVPGATSIAGLFSEDFWKFAWPVKLMEEKLKETWVENVAFPQQIINSHLKQAKNAWREKRDKSADVGTEGHHLIEEWIKNKTIPMVQSGTELANIVGEFKKWEDYAKPKWLASEIQVSSLEHRFCGILDALCEIDGKLTLLDFKTGTSIKDDARIQLAGLMIALEEMGCVPDQRAILHLPKKGEYEFRLITGDLEYEKKDFLSAVPFYGRKNLFLERCKNREKK